jgi:hypothetical protein
VISRVVLDSDVVVSALLFSSGRLAWLRVAWMQGRFVPLASRATIEELIRVLGYPKFGLGPEEISAILADYLPFVETVPAPAGGVGAPVAPDPDDQKFLDLALAGGASLLVTGDRALLAMGTAAGVRVISPGSLREESEESG